MTPKPWRCGLKQNTLRWPYETADQQRGFQQWLTEYDERQRRFATCRFLSIVGSGAVHPAVQPLVDLHDTATRATESLELA